MACGAAESGGWRAEARIRPPASLRRSNYFNTLKIFKTPVDKFPKKDEGAPRAAYGSSWGALSFMARNQSGMRMGLPSGVTTACWVMAVFRSTFLSSLQVS